MDGIAHQPTRLEITDKSNKIAFGGVERLEAGGVLLAAFNIRIHADRFDRNGGDDVFLQLVRLLSIDQAPHVIRLEPWWFFIDKGYEPNGADRTRAFENSRKLQQGSNAAGIVVGAGTIINGVIVRADHDNFTSFSTARNFCNQVADLSHLHSVFLRLHLISELLEIVFDVLRRFLQGFIRNHVAFANLLRDVIDVSCKVGLDLNFFGRQGSESAGERLSRHCNHIGDNRNQHKYDKKK